LNLFSLLDLYISSILISFKMTIIILGTGIIGTSTAYYLSQSQAPSSIHLVEPSPILFASASGYAGGFLAKDWFSSSVAALGALSFEEHQRLAEQHNGREKWGYSRSTGTSYAPGRGKTIGGKNGTDWLRHGASRVEAAAVGVCEFVNQPEDGGPTWLRRGQGDRVEVISEEGSTAQVSV
jgi:glycine/D-amino acid oxidase-like deaminating enzyme